jgi:hypothetical protein
MTLTTPKGRQFAITLELSSTIKDVKTKIKNKQDIDEDKYDLKSGQHTLPDHMTIQDIIDH